MAIRRADIALTNAHCRPVVQWLTDLHSRFEGLTSAEVGLGLTEHGPNCMPEVRSRGTVLRFLGQFHNVLYYVLLGAVVVTAGPQHWVDAGVILAVVLINATVGFVQEGKAEAVMAASRRILTPRAAVLRDGRRLSLDAAPARSG